MRRIWTFHLLSLVAFTLLAPLSYGLVVVTNPLGNTSVPAGMGSEPSDPGFSYVGKVNGSTGVYIGNGWVLTADHVGAGNFNLGGTTYNYNGTDSYQIDGVDLRLFKLSSAPLLAPLTISSTTPTSGDDVVMIGAGRTPTSSSATTWYVDTDPETWVWNTTDFPDADAVGSGFTTNSTKTVRWGTNEVDYIATGATYGGYGAMDMIVTDFDLIGGTAFEVQAVLNDSGSGLFVDQGSGWELAGTIVTVGNYNNQPGGNTSALFGNLTYSIDLSEHADSINGYFLAPVPEVATFSLFVGLFSLLWVNGRRGATRSKTHGSRRCL